MITVFSPFFSPLITVVIASSQVVMIYSHQTVILHAWLALSLVTVQDALNVQPCLIDVYRPNHIKICLEITQLIYEHVYLLFPASSSQKRGCLA